MAQFKAHDAVSDLINGGVYATEDEGMTFIKHWYKEFVPERDVTKMTLGSPVRQDLMAAVKTAVEDQRASTPLDEDTETEATTTVETSDEAVVLPPRVGQVTEAELQAEKLALVPFIIAARANPLENFTALANEVYMAASRLEISEARILELGEDKNVVVTHDDVIHGRVDVNDVWYARIANTMCSPKKSPEEFLASFTWPEVKAVRKRPTKPRASQTAPISKSIAGPPPRIVREAPDPDDHKPDDSTEAPSPRAAAQAVTDREEAKVARKQQKQQDRAATQTASSATSADPDTNVVAPVIEVSTSPRGNRRVSSVGMRPSVPASAAPTQKSTPEPPSQTETSKDATDVWVSRWAGPSEEELNQIAAAAAEVSSDLSIPMDKLLGASS